VRRKLVVLLAALAAVVLWRRAVRHGEYVDVVFDDGSGVRLERGVEARDLLDDARELLAILA
jgi:hypothetical protein